MNNQNCWYNLNLDISNAIRPDFDIINFTSSIRRYTNATDIFTAEWTEYMESLGIPVYAVLMFYRHANELPWTAHVDVNIHHKTAKSEFRSFAINWVIGGRNSEMIWYKMPDHTAPLHCSPAGTPYFQWKTEELTEIERYSIQSQPTLVRVDVPHAISVKEEPRLCISIRNSTMPNDWDLVVKHLSEKQILIPR